MKKIKLLMALLLGLSLPLVACNTANGGNNYDGDGGQGDPGEPAEENAILEKVGELLEYYESTATIDISFLAEFEEVVKDLEFTPAEGDYVASVYFIIEEDIVADVLDAMKLLNWSVPEEPSEEYGYECVDPTETIEVDIFYSKEETEYFAVGTNISIYYYPSLFAGEEEFNGTIAEGIASLLEYYEDTTPVDVSFFDDYEEDVIYKDLSLDGFTSYSVLTIGIEGNVVTELLDAMSALDWSVPEESSEEYGYECADPNEVLEIDVSYLEEDYNGYPAGTYCFVYYYSEIMGGGEEAEEFDGTIVEGIAAVLAEFNDETEIDVSFFEQFEEYVINKYFTPTSDEDYACFEFELEGDFVTRITTALANLGWDVPEEESFWGYDCVDPNEVLEIDVQLYDESEVTYCAVYYYPELYSF